MKLSVKKGGRQPKKYVAHLIYGTHWDREWRYTAEQSRLALADMLDSLLDLLDADPALKHFHLDGGAVALEDYAAARPAASVGRLRRHIRSGRILVTPWYTLPETSTVRDEALVRNLLFGVRLGRRFGCVMRLGYNCTGNGQISQLPQLYAGFGMDTILFYRGINKHVAPPAFLWEAPDGTQALTIRLFDDFTRTNFFFLAYRPRGGDPEKEPQPHAGPGLHFRLASNTADALGSYYQHLGSRCQYRPERLARAIRAVFNQSQPHAIGPHLLWMHAEDNARPFPELTRIVRDATRVLPGVEIAIDSLPAYAAAVRRETAGQGLPVLRGEMRHTNRDPGWNGLLSAVFGQRVILKQANEKAETALIGRAEPLAVAAMLQGRAYPKAELDRAWKALLQNHAHDSINGCSNDRVHEDALARAALVKDLSDELSRRSLHHLASKIEVRGGRRSCGLIAFNLSGEPREESIEFFADLPRNWHADSLSAYDADGRRIAMQVLRREKVRPAVEDPLDATTTFPATRVFGALAPRSLPAFSYDTFELRAGVSTGAARIAQRSAVRSGARWAENEHLRVEFQRCGALIVIHKATGKRYSGLHVFEDQADTGHAWRFATLPEPPIDSRKTRAVITRIANGPMLARFRIQLELAVPVAADYKMTRREPLMAALPIVTEVTLRAGARRLEFMTRIENRARDHRLRVLFDTGLARAEHHWAESPFDVVKRAVRHPDTTGWNEPHVPTQPMGSFIDVSDARHGLAVLARGLREYEVMDNRSRTIALTLFRANRHQMWPNYEPTPAELELMQGPQSQGAHCCEYAVYPHAGDWQAGGVMGQAHAFRMPPDIVLVTPHAGKMPPAGNFLVRAETGDARISAVKRAEDRESIVLRIYNPSPAPAEVRLALPPHAGGLRCARLLTFEEKPLRNIKPAAGAVKLRVAPGQILTVELGPRRI